MISTTRRFDAELAGLPAEVYAQAQKAIALLMTAGSLYPGLRTKRLHNAADTWEARVNEKYRLIYKRVPGGIQFRRLIHHHVLDSARTREF